MFRKILWLTIFVLIFVTLTYIFTHGLKRDQQQMPSALLNKPLPNFSLSDLYNEDKIYQQKDLIGEVFLINVFASWCPPCAKEHDVIIELSKQGYKFIGLNYQDNRSYAQIWIDERGNPYQKILFDPEGDVGMDWGVIGVPETFIVDAKGIVRYRHIGMLTMDIWNERFLPMMQTLLPNATSPYPFNNIEDEARFINLTEKLRCLVCQNQTILDSDATLAKDLRAKVYEQILAGKTDDDIIHYLTTRYGDFILYQPPMNKNTSILWFAPVLLLLIAGGVVIVIVRRAHQHNKGERK